MDIEDFRLSSVGVRRDKKHENLFDILCKENAFSDKTLFQYVKDLMIFAAFIGQTNNKMIPLASGVKTNTITLDTFSSDQKDSFVYLLALMENKDATCLKNENLYDAVKVFEGYCNGGLELIQQWFVDNSSESDVMNILLEKIYEQIQKNDDNASSFANDEIEVEF